MLPLTDPEEIFGRAYDVLIEHAKAAPRDRAYFVRLFSTDRRANEYRFQGVLGFGGKFYRDDARYYVTCYPEDSTPEREAVVTRVNELLKQLPYWTPPRSP